MLMLILSINLNI